MRHASSPGSQARHTSGRMSYIEQDVATPTLPIRAVQRSPMQRIRDVVSVMNSAGIRAISASVSSVKRGHSREKEQQAPQLWQSGISASANRASSVSGTCVSKLRLHRRTNGERGCLLRTISGSIAQVARMERSESGRPYPSAPGCASLHPGYGGRTCHVAVIVRKRLRSKQETAPKGSGFRAPSLGPAPFSSN